MVNVSESDVAVASKILHDKSKKAKVLRWSGLGVLIASFIFFTWMMLNGGETDLPESMLIALLFTGFVALWLVFIASSIINVRAAWGFGMRGKAAVFIALFIPLYVCLSYFPGWGAGWFFWFWWAMFAPFATPVFIELVMLLTGFFVRSSKDGDEQLAQAISSGNKKPAQDTYRTKSNR